MDQVETILGKAIVYRVQVFELAAVNRNEETLQLMKNSYATLLNQMDDVLEQIAEQSDNSAADMVKQGQKFQMASMAAVMIVIGFSAVLAVVLGLYISRGIRRPIEEIQEEAEKMAAGNLAVSIDYQSKDELGQLSVSMRSLVNTFRGIIDDMSQSLAKLGNGDFTVKSKAAELYVGDFRLMESSLGQIIKKLSQVMVQINQSSYQVSAGSDQVSASVPALSQGAAEQAASVEKLAAMINDISSRVKKNVQIQLF